MKLTDEEKEVLRRIIRSYCGGTPLQPHTDLAENLFAPWIIGLIENIETIFPRSEEFVEAVYDAPIHLERK
jgi:hypothetical protein